MDGLCLAIVSGEGIGNDKKSMHLMRGETYSE